MKLGRRRENRVDVNMTPMIDVVFLLIIFFMTVSQVSKVNKERLELPELEGNVDQGKSEMTVNVLADGELRIQGRTVTEVELVDRVARVVEASGGDAGRVSVVLRVDRDADSRPVNEVVQTLAELGVQRTRIAVRVPQ